MTRDFISDHVKEETSKKEKERRGMKVQRDSQPQWGRSGASFMSHEEIHGVGGWVSLGSPDAFSGH